MEARGFVHDICITVISLFDAKHQLSTRGQMTFAHDRRRQMINTCNILPTRGDAFWSVATRRSSYWSTHQPIGDRCAFRWSSLSVTELEDFTEPMLLLQP